MTVALDDIPEVMDLTEGLTLDSGDEATSLLDNHKMRFKNEFWMAAMRRLKLMEELDEKPDDLHLFAIAVLLGQWEYRTGVNLPF